jgi:hypothetical protein
VQTSGQFYILATFLPGEGIQTLRIDEITSEGIKWPEFEIPHSPRSIISGVLFSICLRLDDFVLQHDVHFNRSIYN